MSTASHVEGPRTDVREAESPSSGRRQGVPKAANAAALERLKTMCVVGRSWRVAAAPPPALGRAGELPPATPPPGTLPPRACGVVPVTRKNAEELPSISLRDTTRHDTTRHDTTRHDTTRHDTTRHDTTRHDTSACAGGLCCAPGGRLRRASAASRGPRLSSVARP